MNNLIPYPKFKAFDTSGNPLNGGKVYTYDSGTTTPKTTYTDAALSVPNDNPIVLDSNGEGTIYSATPLKIILKTSADVTLWTMDVVTPLGALTDKLDAANNASQAEMEAASATTKYVTPAIAKYHPGIAKAWAQVTVSGGTPTANVAYNCTVTDLGKGHYQFNFTVPFSTANYAAAAMAAMDSGVYVAVAHFDADNLPSTSACKIYTLHTGDASPVDPAILSIAFFGDQ